MKAYMARPRLLLVLSLVLLAPIALASADLSVTSFTSDKTTAQYAEPISLNASIVNNGPDAATNLALHFVIGVGYPMSVGAPPGWTCSPLFRWSGSIVCGTASFAAGAQADFQTTVLVYSKPGTAYEATVLSSADPVASNNTRTLTVFRSASGNQEDLSVTANPARTATPAGTPATVRANVRNNGAAAVSNVHLIVFSEATREGVEVTGSGAGWTCTSHVALVECRRPSLGAGETAPVDVTVRSPAERIMDFDFRVIAEKNDDPFGDNNRVDVRIGAGNAEDWTMFLIPIDSQFVPGANGSLWFTDITLLLRSTTTVDVRPLLCELPIIDCGFPAPPPPPPVNVPVDYEVRSANSLGQYLYVPAADAHKVHVNIRTFDTARSHTTGGAEIPFVSEEQFRGDTVSLLGIPLADEHRYTLRVYDAHARAGARVQVHVYADDEETPRKSLVGTLAGGGPSTTTTALLPIHPATLQIDPIAGLDLAGVKTLRVDVEPLDEGLRLWSFVSITNNETHHVTTVSQR